MLFFYEWLYNLRKILIPVIIFGLGIQIGYYFRGRVVNAILKSKSDISAPLCTKAYNSPEFEYYCYRIELIERFEKSKQIDTVL